MRFDGYALLIGTGKTQSAQFSPIPVTNDVESLHALLIDPNVCGYQPDHIKVLTNEQATSRNIDLALAWLKEQSASHPDAPILFFYSGHGWSDYDDHYYLIQYDVEDTYLSDTAYDAQNLMRRLNAISAKQMVIVFDCCRAGGVAAGKDRQEPEPVLAKGRNIAPPEALRQALSQRGRVVFSSSLEGQKSWFHPQVAISLFTYYFLEGLQGANAKANDTMVRIDQLIGHVSREVEAASQKMPQLQTPTFMFDGQNFPIALLQGGKGLGSGGWQAAKPQATATIERVVRHVTQTVGDRSVAIGGNANGATIITGDSNRVIRDSPGYVENARNVQQDFSQRTVNTGSGDYAERDIHKKTMSGGVDASGATFGNNATLAGRDVNQGNVTVSGGTVHGPVTGLNQGTVNYTTHPQPSTPSRTSLQQVLDQLNPLVTRLQSSGDDELHDQVQQIALHLRAALRAEQNNNHPQRTSKIQAAQAALREVSSAQPDLAALHPLIEQLG